MAQLDKLLTAMMTNHASALVLTDGEVVKLEIGGQLRPLTKTPLTPTQILGLLQEVATPNDQAAIETGNPVEILRATPDGAFVIKGQLVDGKWRAVVSIGKGVPESKPEKPAPDASPGMKKPAAPAMPSPAAAPAPAPAAASASATVAEGAAPDLDSIPWFE